MRTRIYILCILCIALLSPAMQAQQKNRAVSRSTNEIFILRGSVLDTETMKPVNKVNVEVTGGAYTKTGRDGEFRIEAKIGDELVVKSEDFETVYYTLKLPDEYHFQLVDLRDFQRINHNFATWISDPAYSVEPAELDRRFNAYKDYGLEPKKRVQSVNVIGRKAVRTGEYKAFFKNQKLKLEGSYYPKVTEIFDADKNSTVSLNNSSVSPGKPTII